MKRLFLGALLLALAAAPALAATPGRLARPSEHNGSSALPRPTTQPLGSPGASNDETPTRPVPEPGTMALTSLGLLALGAAAKKRRGN